MSDISERSHFRCEFPDRHDASIPLKSWDKLRTLATVADNLVERNSNVAESLAKD